MAPVDDSRYAEAFWWVVPIPLALLAGLVLTVRSPSAPRVAALAVFAGIGLALEAEVWHRFRRRWAGDTDVHPMDIPRPLREPVRVVILGALLVGAIVGKSVGLGYGWLSGLFSGLGLLAFYLVAWLVERWMKRS